MSLTYSEILNQPNVWQRAIEEVPAIWNRVSSQLDTVNVGQVIYVGCGTSWYIAQAAAHSFTELTGISAGAVPASEVFLSPDSVIPATGSVIVFIISRSGTTSEALLAAAYLNTLGDRVQTVGVTCHQGTPLAETTDATIELAFAAELSVVMTQSFTTMVLALQLVAAIWADKTDVIAELAKLPVELESRFPEFDAFAHQFGDTSQYALTVFLGLGAYQGLAHEATLKLKEMTQQPCEAYNPLEFRHGPISIVDDHTLVVLIEGQRERDYILDVERDILTYGAEVTRLAPYVSNSVDSGLIFGSNLSDVARSCLYLPALQLLALYRAQFSGLDPDRPRNLSQVVVLNER